MNEFWLAFLPMFVAVDPVGMLPVFLSLTAGIDPVRRRKVILQSVITALLVALGFLAIGNKAIQLLGVTIPDFLIAGGAMLFVFALADLLSSETGHNRVSESDTLGAVPLAVPLIVGPGVLATSLVLLKTRGVTLTIASISANILLAGIVMAAAGTIVRIIGNVGARVTSKLASLILAAMAVMFIRRGIMDIIASLRS